MNTSETILNIRKSYNESAPVNFREPHLSDHVDVSIERFSAIASSYRVIVRSIGSPGTYVTDDPSARESEVLYNSPAIKTEHDAKVLFAEISAEVSSCLTFVTARNHVRRLKDIFTAHADELNLVATRGPAHARLLSLFKKRIVIETVIDTASRLDFDVKENRPFISNAGAGGDLTRVILKGHFGQNIGEWELAFTDGQDVALDLYDALERHKIHNLDLENNDHDRELFVAVLEVIDNF